MNVLYIVKYKNTPGKCAYVVVSKEQSKCYRDMLDPSIYRWCKFEPDELTVTCLPSQIRNEANKIISDHGQCHIYYSHDRGWCCTCDYRDIEDDEYYAGEYTKHEFDYLRKLMEVLI
mgnify:CR=1 FL=1